MRLTWQVAPLGVAAVIACPAGAIAAQGFGLTVQPSRLSPSATITITIALARKLPAIPPPPTESRALPDAPVLMIVAPQHSKCAPIEVNLPDRLGTFAVGVGPHAGRVGTGITVHPKLPGGRWCQGAYRAELLDVSPFDLAQPSGFPLVERKFRVVRPVRTPPCAPAPNANGREPPP